MASRNDITGDELTSKASTASYRDGWDRIFGQSKTNQEQDMANKIFAVNRGTKKAVRLSTTIDWSKLEPHLDEISSASEFIGAMHRLFPGPSREQLANWLMKADQISDIGFPFQLVTQGKPLEGMNGVMIVAGITRHDQNTVGDFLSDHVV